MRLEGRADVHYLCSVSQLPPFIRQLAERLKQPLPGLSVQMEMTSRPDRATQALRDDHRKSGVLALMYMYQEALHLVFMQRATYEGVHSGQVSFPGGRVDPGDSDLVFTALRESQEELGIIPEGVQVIGQLSPLYIPPSNFLVYPTVGYMDRRPDFVPSAREVAKVIEVELAHLLRPEVRQQPTIRLTKDLRMRVPAFIVDGYIIWGATAMMLNELLYLIREVDPAS
jgi:8-oxo-dGTP pyrophosphatase MutT (NUDIX family)